MMICKNYSKNKRPYLQNNHLKTRLEEVFLDKLKYLRIYIYLRIKQIPYLYFPLFKRFPVFWYIFQRILSQLTV